MTDFPFRCWSRLKIAQSLKWSAEIGHPKDLAEIMIKLQQLLKPNEVYCRLLFII